MYVEAEQWFPGIGNGRIDRSVCELGGLLGAKATSAPEFPTRRDVTLAPPSLTGS